jgi:Na+-driven multidrug efflux pump
MNMEQNQGFMESEHIGRLMRRYAVPCTISLLVAALYNIVDQLFIANTPELGSYGNAANTVVFPLTVVVREVVFGVGFALLLPLFFGLDGVLYSMPVSDVLTFLLSCGVLLYLHRTVFRSSRVTPV